MNGLKSHSQNSGNMDEIDNSIAALNDALAMGLITVKQWINLHGALLEEAIMLEIEKAQRGEGLEDTSRSDDRL